MARMLTLMAGVATLMAWCPVGLHLTRTRSVATDDPRRAGSAAAATVREFEDALKAGGNATLSRRRNSL